MENSQNLIGIAGIVTAICTAVYHIYRVRKIFKIDRDQFRRSILKEAEDNDQIIRLELHTKIESLQTELNNLRFNVDKDIKFMKETYTSEIKNLGEKIENLREEIRDQHTNLLHLITKLVERS